MHRYLLLLAVALIAAACSSSGSDTTTTTTVAAPGTTAATTATTLAAGTTVPPTTGTTRPGASTTSAAGDGSDGTTSTTQPRRTTTTTTLPRTTTSAPSATPPPGSPPSVSIVSPGQLARFQAKYNPSLERFVATASLQAAVSDPDGHPVTVDWYSSIDGYLGTGTAITATLGVVGDASQPFIRAVATDSVGATSEASLQVVVWIPSDQ